MIPRLSLWYPNRQLVVAIYWLEGTPHDDKSSVWV